MPLSPQPRGARGTVGHPYSALTLRLLLAAFGLIVFAAMTVLLLRAGFELMAVLTGALAVVALVNIVVVQSRRRAARRQQALDLGWSRGDSNP
ncbi:MAG TPA: hypothetical protein VFR67_12350 [Pilimelia sp.]|nr:hypothetical protein [Pilimelia sp.]